MISRFSVNALLKTVIAIMAAAVVVMFLMSAWQSWARLVSVNRIAAVAEVSGDLFTALHNLRVDRATTTRDLNSDEQFATLPDQLKEVRGDDMLALKSAVAKLAGADVPDQQNIFNSLNQSVTKLVELHQQTEAALAQTKSARPVALAKEYSATTTALMDQLDRISTQLTNSVKLEDSYIDQLMELKQLAWIARNGGGDASVVISNALGGLPLPPDPMAKYQINLAKVDTAWAALEDLASGLPVPAHFKNALEDAKREFFGADYTQLRLKTLKQLIAGEKVSMSADTWSKMSVSKLASLLNVAVAALEAAKEYAANQHGKILWKLWFDLGMLAAAIALVIVMMLVVSRRVTGPLRDIQQAMLKVATGDFNVVLPGLNRKDEIGDMANAVERFKVLADEKARAEVGTGYAKSAGGSRARKAGCAGGSRGASESRRRARQGDRRADAGGQSAWRRTSETRQRRP